MIVKLLAHKGHLNKFLATLKKLHINIKFTIEMEENSTINFLGLTITK